MKKWLIVAMLITAAAYSQERPKPEEVYKHDRLEVDVPDFAAEGLILDIGGGGEAVISQLKGKQVVAIDLLKRELEDAPGQPLLKIVMDARNLQFLDHTFPTVTAFFTFMYMNPAEHEKVFQEIHRVLQTGGRFLLWDVTFPKRTDERQRFVLYPLHIKLPTKEITTGYGVHFAEGQGADHYTELAGKTGFDLVSRRDAAGWYYLEFRAK